MSARSLATRVTCSVCGKTLRGHESLGSGFHVRRHKNDATGKTCWGSIRTDHRAVAQATGGAS